ncbi:MAG: hypothetical protein ICV76_07685 [Nitrospiraceae bacterium]|nr:hypothetical protein [Nitrospiraceae bacterium]
MTKGPMIKQIRVYGCVLILAIWLAPGAALGQQEAALVILPIRPFSFDVAFSQRTFAPDNRTIGIQAGLTALRYGNLEVRAIYQYYSNHGTSFTTDQHSLYINPRWNNFIDILDFPKGTPINRVIRHVLFGPLENRAVPYIGLLAGGTFPGPGHDAPGHLIGGQIGARFPVARGLSVDMAIQYTQFGIDSQGEAGHTQQWLFTTGVRF